MVARTSRWWTVVGAGALALVIATGTTAIGATTGVGTPGVGDPFFPSAGNGGYEVGRYDLQLAWNPSTNVLSGTARIDATTTQPLQQFDLDLRAFTVDGVKVNGAAATFTRNGQELIVRPAHALARGARMRVDVRYHGVPQPVTDADGSIDGWVRTDDGAVVLSEPQGSPTWFPSNDHPSDKATFVVSMTVPGNLRVIGNGLPDAPRRNGSRTTFTWRERRPMAPYLATVAIGRFVVMTGRTPSGIPIINAVDPKLADASKPTLRRVEPIVEWQTKMFGPYPFESVGATVDDAPDVGYALETQTRPTFTFPLDNDYVLAHELAHQWFGDSVSLRSWPEIWLNEGFATYAEWLWAEHTGAATTRSIFDSLYKTDVSSSLWTAPPGPSVLPGPADLFDDSVYDRGAMTLQALRDTIGDRAFFTVLRRWAQLHRDGNVSTSDFIALAERVSGRQLDALFHAWLDEPERPPLPPHHTLATSGAASDMRRVGHARHVAPAHRP